MSIRTYVCVCAEHRLTVALLGACLHRFVEGLLESAGFTLTETLRDTYPFNLSSDDELAFKLTTLPVKNPLDELVQSGKKPDAWEVARARFDRAIASGEFGDRDSETNDIVVGGNCFKMVVASKN